MASQDMGGKVVRIKPDDELHVWINHADGKKETVAINPIETAEYESATSKTKICSRWQFPVMLAFALTDARYAPFAPDCSTFTPMFFFFIFFLRVASLKGGLFKGWGLSSPVCSPVFSHANIVKHSKRCSN